MSSLLEQASLVVTPNGTKASKLYSVKPTDGSGDMTVVRETTATRVNSSGLIKSSAVNVPRLDYTGSTCPSILVEPQRTNLLLRSEEFDNAIWNTSEVTITPNVSISPNGSLTAVRVLISGGGFIFQDSTCLPNTVYTFSFYARLGTIPFNKFLFALRDNTNGVFIAQDLVPNVTLVTTEWRRVTYTFTTPVGCLSLRPYVYRNTSSYNVGDTFFVWGAQLEAGANATSYIPTTTASVTRNADVISKTGISDLIGQTEGTIFAEVNFTASNLSDRTIVNLSDNTTANWIFIRTSATVPNGIRFRIANGGALQFDYNSSAISAGVHKLCLSYKLNNISAYIDGVKVSSSTTATIPATSKINIGCMHDNLLQFNDRIKSALLFKTQLTDQECINLTTI